MAKDGCCTFVTKYAVSNYIVSAGFAICGLFIFLVELPADLAASLTGLGMMLIGIYTCAFTRRTYRIDVCRESVIVHGFNGMRSWSPKVISLHDVQSVELAQVMNRQYRRTVVCFHMKDGTDYYCKALAGGSSPKWKSYQPVADAAALIRERIAALVEVPSANQPSNVNDRRIAGLHRTHPNRVPPPPPPPGVSRPDLG